MKITNKIGRYKIREWYQRATSDIQIITVHHSAIEQRLDSTDDAILKRIQQTHQSRGWPGLSYHFVITPNGNIYQTNAYTDKTWHDGINNDSLGILVHGYMHAPYNDNPTTSQLNSLKWLLDFLCTQQPQIPANQADVYGHRERTPTACPGDIIFPYVLEYRNNFGNVSWGHTNSADLNSQLQQQIELTNRFKYLYEQEQKKVADLTREISLVRVAVKNEIEKRDLQIKRLKQQVAFYKDSGTHIETSGLASFLRKLFKL
jgi:N-acetyl-anhydromuramyl-L-alanine amidase AmpD